MKLKIFLSVALCVITTFNVVGDILTFSNSTPNTYDLTAAQTWEVNRAPSEGDICLIKSGGNTFTASKDFSCSGIYFTSSSTINTFQLEKDKTGKSS